MYDAIATLTRAQHHALVLTDQPMKDTGLRQLVPDVSVLDEEVSFLGRYSSFWECVLVREGGVGLAVWMTISGK